MSIEHLQYARTIERLDLLARLTTMFHHSERARLIWTRHHQHQFGKMPAIVVSTSDGLQDFEGLLIHGQRDGSDWDFDGTLTLLTEDGEIVSVNGWMATEMETW